MFFTGNNNNQELGRAIDDAEFYRENYETAGVEPVREMTPPIVDKYPTTVYDQPQGYPPVIDRFFPAPEISTPVATATVITDVAGNIQPVKTPPVERIPKFRRRSPPVIDRFFPAPEITTTAANVQPTAGQQTIESGENLIFGFDAKTVLIAGGVGAAILFFMSGKGK